MNKERLRCGSSTAAIEHFDKEVIDMYAKAGVTAVEVALPFVNYFAHDWKEIKKYADTIGVELWSVHLPFGGENNMFNIASPEFAERTVSDDERLIIKAGEVGMKAAVVHPNTGLVPNLSRRKQWEISVNSLNELVKIGRREGVEIAVEVLAPDNLGSNIAEMRAFMDEVPGLKICMDMNHLSGYTHEEFVKAFGDKIVTVHISDYDFDGEKHWMPGEGKIDWQHIIKLLDSINYTGPFMYEVGGEKFRKAGLCAIKENYTKLMKGEI
ncbi:MAG: sugar phosphate isomerase/epimerase [Clostridia bacterium]|nr:sugar phosphate isomerase/epimerase [Clostridia bacterium]